MEAIYHAFQHWMLCACLAGLGMIAALVFLAKVAAPAWDALRRWWSLPCIQRVIVGVCVVGLSYYGATKQGWHVAYDGGIKAGATANVVTNDTVAIYWQRDTSGGVYVPESAAVYIDYRPNTETNAEWGLLAQTTVGAWGWSGTVANATNYDYNVWAYYIPPEPVHTNSVWTYKTHFDRSGEYALPLRARVEVNGVAIATPAEKRKDAEKLPYDAEVEYLESTGTQWIDTGYVYNEDSKFVCDAMLMSVPSDTFATMFGAVQSYRGVFLALNNTVPIQARFGANSVGNIVSDLSVQNAVGVRHKYELSARRLAIDDDVFTRSGFTPYTVNRSIWLCSCNDSDSGNLNRRPCSLRVYTFAIYNGNVLVRDFIPVRVGTTGAMYDKRGVGGMNPDGTARNDGLYFNRGTGNFGYGNDK